MGRPKVSISFTTYNHENFVIQSLDSILAQVTNFDFEIVIGEDCSTDKTREICLDYYNKFPDIVKILPRETNIGPVRNYIETYKACQGKYVAYLEGDDYWTDPYKLQKQVDFLDANPEFVICCHNVMIVYESGLVSRLLLADHPEDCDFNLLCRGDFIATASCMVRNRLLEDIPDWIYTLYGCDWAFDLLNARHGRIKYFSESMAIYRIHSKGLWSSLPERNKLEASIDVITKLDKHFDFKYNHEFENLLVNIYIEMLKYLDRDREEILYAQYIDKLKSISTQNKIAHNFLTTHLRLPQYVKKNKSLPSKILAELKRVKRNLRKFGNLLTVSNLTNKVQYLLLTLVDIFDFLKSDLEKQELIILDNVYPHPLSAFRLQEYNYYLANFKKVKIYTTGESLVCFNEKKSLHRIIRDFEAQYPEFRGKVGIFNRRKRLSANLIYTIFIGNAAVFLETIEKFKIPFAFTLYPGGAFQLNNKESDARLKMVFASQYFRKVIVTQQITYNYLLNHNYCTPEQIEYIFGVVISEQILGKSPSCKKFYHQDKPHLDICFVAHKYMEKGIDKGYDIFIHTAKILCSRHTNIKFHVVGGFDQNEIPVNDILDNISFYGYQTSDWFDQFYVDKDIILSPNVPFKLLDGAFDGFPTGCCTDANFHKVAVFCTDPLNLNSKYIDREDIVIIPYDLEKIIDIIEYYISKPDELRLIAENGYRKTVEVYSFDSQMAPRLRILEELILAR